MKAFRIGTHLAMVLLFTTVLVTMGCAKPRPFLYPNDHLKDVGQEKADRDIAECRNMADEHAASVSGAAGGAVTGDAGAGAAIGAVAGATTGLIRGCWGPPNRVGRI